MKEIKTGNTGMAKFKLPEDHLDPLLRGLHVVCYFVNHDGKQVIVSSVAPGADTIELGAKLHPDFYGPVAAVFLHKNLEQILKDNDTVLLTDEESNFRVLGIGEECSIYLKLPDNDEADVLLRGLRVGLVVSNYDGSRVTILKVFPTDDLGFKLNIDFWADLAIQEYNDRSSEILKDNKIKLGNKPTGKKGTSVAKWNEGTMARTIAALSDFWRTNPEMRLGEIVYKAYSSLPHFHRAKYIQHMRDVEFMQGLEQMRDTH